MSNKFWLSACVLAALSGGALAQVKDIAPPAVNPAPAVEPTPKDPASPAKKEVKITLKVGDPAPAIVVDKWIKGTEVKSFEKGKVYVVEFWATWCGPCIKNIPHMTELAASHKDVTFIGVAASEHMEDNGSDQRLEKLKTFVKNQGDKMGYTVAYDPDRKMGNPWMRASGQTGIPCAFVVNGEGKISWIGYPMELDEPLAEAAKTAKPSKNKADPATKTKKTKEPAEKKKTGK